MEEILKSYTVVVGPMSQFTTYVKNNKFSVGELIQPEIGQTYNLLLLLTLLQCNFNPDCPTRQLTNNTQSKNWLKLHRFLKRVETSIVEIWSTEGDPHNYEFFIISDDSKLPKNGTSSECSGSLVQVLLGLPEEEEYIDDEAWWSS